MFKVTRFHAVANRAQHQQQQWIECNRSKCFLCFVVFFFVFVSFLYFELNWSKWRKRRNNAFAKEENARSFIDYHPLSSGFGFYLCVARRQRKFEKFWFYKRIELIWKLNECFFYIACIGWGISVYFFFFLCFASFQLLHLMGSWCYAKDIGRCVVLQCADCTRTTDDGKVQGNSQFAATSIQHKRDWASKKIKYWCHVERLRTQNRRWSNCKNST